jgi:hypothetical protein
MTGAAIRRFLSPGTADGTSAGPLIAWEFDESPDGPPAVEVATRDGRPLVTLRLVGPPRSAPAPTIEPDQVAAALDEAAAAALAYPELSAFVSTKSQLAEARTRLAAAEAERDRLTGEYDVLAAGPDADPDRVARLRSERDFATDRVKKLTTRVSQLVGEVASWYHPARAAGDSAAAAHAREIAQEWHARQQAAQAKLLGRILLALVGHLDKLVAIADDAAVGEGLPEAAVRHLAAGHLALPAGVDPPPTLAARGRGPRVSG